MDRTIRYDVHRLLMDGHQGRVQELERLLDEAHERHMKLMERAHAAEIRVEELLVALGGEEEPPVGPGMATDTASFKLRQLLRAEEHLDAIRAAIRIAKDQLLESEDERLGEEDEQQAAVYDAVDRLQGDSSSQDPDWYIKQQGADVAFHRMDRS